MELLLVAFGLLPTEDDTRSVAPAVVGTRLR